MALIKCTKCGKMISDKAKACPHCGTLVDFEQIVNDESSLSQNQETEPNRVVTSEPVEYYVKTERKSHAGLIITAVLGLLALFSVGGWLWYDSNQKRAEQERQMAILAEKARQDSIAAAELREQARRDSMEKVIQQELIEKNRQAYINILKGYLRKFGVDEYGWYGYFLYDITRDGVPELWVKAGTCEADFMLYVYTLKDGVASKIYEDGSSHSSYYRGGDYVLQWWAHMGSAAMNRFTYDGSKIKIRCVYEEDNIESSYDYKQPSELEIHLNRFDDYSSINEAFR